MSDRRNIDDRVEVTTETRTERRTVAIARPEYVSQHTSLPVLGLDGRGYLGLLTEYREAGGEVLSIGKRRLVALDAFASWLRRRGATDKATPVADEVDTYAASLRLVASGGGR